MRHHQIEPPHIPTDCQHCAIREATLCSAMPSDKLEYLQAFKTCDRIIPSRTHLYRAGDHPREIYNLLSGWVALYRILESGKRQVLQIAHPGAFLGYQVNLEDPMLHGAECITDVSVCVFPRRTFPALLERHPALGAKLIGMLAHAVVEGHDQLENMGGRSGIERVAYFLLKFYMQQRQHAQPTSDDSHPMPLTQEMIGDALGFTPIHINRILRQLRERQIAILLKGVIEVRNIEELRRMAGI